MPDLPPVAYRPTGWHLDTHRNVNPEMPLGDIIEECAAMTINHLAHFSHNPFSYPLFGGFAVRTSGSWCHFSMDEVMALDEIGPMLAMADAALRKHYNYPGIRPLAGIFGVRVQGKNGLQSTDAAHLEIWRDNRAAEGISPDRILEVGVGNIYKANRYPETVLTAASVVLRQELIGGEELLSARAYAKSDEHMPDDLVAVNDLLDTETCKAFLNMQRHAMWNTGSEPA